MTSSNCMSECVVSPFKVFYISFYTCVYCLLEVTLPHFLISLLTQNHSSELNATKDLVFHYFSDRWKIYKANFILKEVHFWEFFWFIFKEASYHLQSSKKQISKNFIYKLIKKCGRVHVQSNLCTYNGHPRDLEYHYVCKQLLCRDK